MIAREISQTPVVIMIVMVIQGCGPGEMPGLNEDNCLLLGIPLALTRPELGPSVLRLGFGLIFGAYVGVWGCKLAFSDASHVMRNDSFWHFKIDGLTAS